MKSFKHYDARSIDEAVSLLERYGNTGKVIGGGTDILGKMKDRVLPGYPEALINIKTIPGLKDINQEDKMLKIGALVTLDEISQSPVIQEQYFALAQAAGRTASPQLRNMGTISGNICQDIRCWYYRAPDNRFSCLRKGGGRCYALMGDNRFHSIFGASVEGGCVAVHPSDTAPALVALDAKVVTSKRTIEMEDFINVGVKNTTVLGDNEIVTSIQVPEPKKGSSSAFIKYALRKSIDFPVVNCATATTIDNGQVTNSRICMNAVYVVPRRASAAEEAINGKTINEEVAEMAGDAAVSDAKPLKDNAYMVQIAKTLVKRTILACAE
jgi:xanthine dehydrogenase YagS FAD-binding subunit